MVQRTARHPWAQKNPLLAGSFINPGMAWKSRDFKMAVCAGSPQPVSDGNSRKQRIFQGIFASLIANPYRKRGARAVLSSVQAQIGSLLTGNVSGSEQGASREWNRDGSFGNRPVLNGYGCLRNCHDPTLATVFDKQEFHRQKFLDQRCVRARMTRGCQRAEFAAAGERHRQ